MISPSYFSLFLLLHTALHNVKLHLNRQTDTSVCPCVRGKTQTNSTRGVNPILTILQVALNPQRMIQFSFETEQKRTILK